MSVYKPFKPKDYSVVPFNAHKQYDFTSASAVANKITHHTIFFDSDSPVDQYNDSTIKYNQFEHLFYRNYITDISNKFGDINYIKHKRALYEKANIMSIPAGLYGHKIKPGSFNLKTNNQSIIDDTYGNLIVSGTNVNNYIIDPRSTLLDIGPVKGFKRYNLNNYNEFENGYYKKGQPKVNTISSYNTPPNRYEYDDSYFLNKIYYNDVKFNRFPFVTNPTSDVPCIEFNGTGSEVKLYNDPKFNFNQGENFSIEFWVNCKDTGLHEDENKKAYLIGKSTTETSFTSPSDSLVELSQENNIPAGTKYPFEVYIQSESLFFERSDGDIIQRTGVQLEFNKFKHIVCRYSSSNMNIFVDGVIQPGIFDSSNICQNNANIYIGNRGGYYHYFSGSLSQIKIYDQALTNTQVQNHYVSIIGSPYVGNIFYSNGFAAVTHPRYQNSLSTEFTQFGISTMVVDNENEDIGIFTVGGIGVLSTEGSENATGIQNLKFQGSHLIYENEYKCTIDEHEYNFTLNPTVRKNRSINNDEIADFAKTKLFKPYITTIGLYNENNELLVVGKLGQPIRTSNETDTTLIIRWDT